MALERTRGASALFWEKRESPSSGKRAPEMADLAGYSGSGDGQFRCQAGAQNSCQQLHRSGGGEWPIKILRQSLPKPAPDQNKERSVAERSGITDQRCLTKQHSMKQHYKPLSGDSRSPEKQAPCPCSVFRVRARQCCACDNQGARRHPKCGSLLSSEPVPQPGGYMACSQRRLDVCLRRMAVYLAINVDHVTY